MKKIQKRIQALSDYQNGKISMIKQNIEIYLENSVGIGEHPNVMEELLIHFKNLAEEEDILNTIKNYLKEIGG